MWKNLALLLASLLITLAGLEGAIRLGWVERPYFSESSGWWREHWLATRRGPVPNAFVKLDDDLGWVPAPNLDRMKYQGAHLSTNSMSLRGKREHVPGKADHPRIVAVGDSYMFGQCLDDEDTIPAQVEKRLPGSEVINIGVMGYGQGQMLSRLLRDGMRYRPDVVMLGFYQPDIERSRLFFRDYAKPRYKLKGGKLVLTNVPVGEPEDWEGGLRSLDFAYMLWDKLRAKAVRREERELSGALVDAMADAAQKAGAGFVVIHFPSRFEVNEHLPLPKFVQERCRAHDWLCLEPGPLILKAFPHRRTRDDAFDCHYSPRLASLIADQTATALRERWPRIFAPH